MEEYSMEANFHALLPRMLPEGCSFEVFRYIGKPALIRNIGDRLKGYSSWISPQHRIVLIVDRDNDDCKDHKSTLGKYCKLAGIPMRLQAEPRRHSNGYFRARLY